MTGAGRKVISYARVSRAKENDALTIAAQHRANTQFAWGRGEPVTEYLEDVGYSGTNEKRPAFQRIRALVEADSVGTIYVHRYDRLYRNADLSRQFEKLCDQHGTTVVSTTEPFSGERPDEHLMRSFISLLNEHLVEVYAAQTLKVLKHKAELGEYTGGGIPYGYKLDEEGKYLTAEPDEANVVRYFFTRYATGISVDTILREADARGFRTRRGLTFTRNAVYGIFGNPIYAGNLIFNRREHAPRGGPRNDHRLKDESEWIRAKCEALVSEELFAEVARRLDARTAAKARARHPYPLTGLLVCGECGREAHLVGTTRREQRLYRCATKQNHRDCRMHDIDAKTLEDAVFGQLQPIFNQPEIVQKITQRVNELALEKLHYQTEVAALRARQNNRTKAKENLLCVLEKGGEELASVIERLKVLEEELKFITSEISRVAKAARTPVYTREDVMQALARLPESLRRLDCIGESRVMLGSFIERITVSNEKVEITWRK